MRWGMIGGGKGSQIGDAHRIAARFDGLFSLTAAALDADPERGRAHAIEVGFDPARSYGTWREMLESEANRPAGERLDLVTVATPNATHYEICRAFLEAGFNVLCEKPLTMTTEEADVLQSVVEAGDVLCGVNFGYAGYPMVVQAREMVRRGDLGDIRVAVVEFAHGAHASGDDADNPRVRWRYDPAQSGVSSVVADIGTHAFQMAGFVTGQSIASISANFDHCIASRALEDDALMAVRFDGGAVGRIWTSAVAAGQTHGFCFRVFGAKGGLRWHQEAPNQLAWTPVGEPTRTLERGADNLYPESNAGSRIAVGHPEGMLGAFANNYRGLHTAIAARRNGAGAAPLIGYPPVEDGVATVYLVHAAAKSASLNGAWVDARTLATL